MAHSRLTYFLMPPYPNAIKLVVYINYFIFWGTLYSSNKAGIVTCQKPCNIINLSDQHYKYLLCICNKNINL
jgi:hypothetical protein